MPPPIAIIGAGEAGLTLARLLSINNIDYTLFEQHSSDDSNEFWAVMDMRADMSIMVLREAGLWDKVRDVANFETQVTAMFDQHGEILSRNDVEDLVQVDWVDLRAVLVGSIPVEKVRWCWRVVGVERGEDGLMEVRGEDGRVEKGFGLVVGADGMWSKVREKITPIQPRYFGVTYLRTTISSTSPFWSTVNARLNPNSYMAIGSGKSIGSRKHVGGTYTVLVGLPLPEGWSDEAISNPTAFRDKLIKTEFDHWGPRVLNWLRHTDGEFKVFPFYYLPTDALPWKSVPGHVLVGDAAHPSPPWGDEQMGCAMLDSYQLAQQIVNHGLDGLDEAVVEYEKLMFPRAIDIIEKSTDIGSMFYSKDAANMLQALLAGSFE